LPGLGAAGGYVRGETLAAGFAASGCFLCGFNKTFDESYAIQESPERVERNKPAVEAVAVNRTGKRLAIEHTLLQPFEGQKADDQPFLAVFGNLNNDPTLIVSGRLIELHVPVGVIPKGKDWRAVAANVRQWLEQKRRNLPDGESKHTVPGVGFDLEVTIEAMDLPDTPWVLSVGRILPREGPLEDVVQKSLNDKLPKLAACPIWTYPPTGTAYSSNRTTGVPRNKIEDHDPGSPTQTTERFLAGESNPGLGSCERIAALPPDVRTGSASPYTGLNIKSL